MGKYLKLFNTHAEYLAFTQKSDFVKPNVSHCITENHVHYNPIPHDYSKDYLTFVAKENGTFTFTPYNNNVISYSTDNGTTWTNGNSVEVSNGDKVLWKGTMTPASYQGIGTFSSTANFDVQGNIMSLLYGGNYKGETDLTGKNYAFKGLFSDNTKVVNAENLSLPATTLANYCYNNMFFNCRNLTKAPALPATTLASNCYNSMFVDCDALTTAPELPAKTLADSCYYNMFDYCDALTTAPELPATTLADYCYQYMFNGCKALTTAPELPAKTLARYCYSNMFQSCTSLVNAPVLPALTLADNCYQYMFQNCTSLTTAPELPAETLARYCYASMFNGCTSLTTAPQLPAQTLETYCYSYMFYGCTNLNYIKAMFTTTPGVDYTERWVNGVATSGTFVKNSAATWNVTGAYGVPTGWTIDTATA